MEPMTMMLVATAVSSVGQGLLGRSSQSRELRRIRNERVLEASSRSKAEGTETLMMQRRAAENNTETLRQSLQLQGAARASADSAGIAGTSIDESVRNIEMQGIQAMALAKLDADNKIAINRMSNKAMYDSILYTTSTFRPTSLGSILGSAALSTAVQYASAKALSGTEVTKGAVK